MSDNLEKDKIITCEYCNEYQGTANQIKGHKISCPQNPKARESSKNPETTLVETPIVIDGKSPEEPPVVEEESVNPENQTLETTIPQSETITEDEPATRPRETPDRKKRIPMGVRQKTWDTPPDDGFHYHVFNDGWTDHDPNRIQKALNAGYEVVEGEKHKTVGTSKDGSPIKGILMRIPQEFYDEDQELKQKEIDRVDEAIYAGTLESKSGDSRYTPAGIKIHSDNREPNT